MNAFRCLSLVSCDPDVWVEVAGAVAVMPLPARQKARTQLSADARSVYKFIRDYIAHNHGVSPSYREIAAAVGTSAGTAKRLIYVLESAGRIRRIPNRVRALECVSHAGFPSNSGSGE